MLLLWLIVIASSLDRSTDHCSIARVTSSTMVSVPCGLRGRCMAKLDEDSRLRWYEHQFIRLYHCRLNCERCTDSTPS